MGAWGVGPWENDAASDWAFELCEGGDLQVVRAAFDAVDVDGDDVEVDAACEAIAAAEVIALLRGHGTVAVPQEHPLAGWLADGPPAPDEALVALARSALTTVTGDGSELRELWDESGEVEEWLGSVAAIVEALSKPPVKGPR